MDIKSSNGSTLKYGDRVYLVGGVPLATKVYYTRQMVGLLNNKKIYRVEKITPDKTVRVAGWNWDPRNIYKLPSKPKKYPKPVTFDINNLNLT